MRSVGCEILTSESARQHGREMFLVCKSSSETTPAPKRPRKFQILIKEMNVFMFTCEYPRDAPIWPILSMAVVPEPIEQAMVMTRSQKSRDEVACLRL